MRRNTKKLAIQQRIKQQISYQLVVDHGATQLLVDVVKKPIKNINLSVYPPDGRVRISAPWQVDDATIRAFAIAKLEWIRQKQAKILARPRQAAKQYISGESHYYKGDRYLLNVIDSNLASKVVIRDRTRLDLYVKKGSDQEQRTKVLTKWYRQQLKAELPDLIAHWQEIIGVQINDWGVKKMKTRWGTCNIRAKRIWLNLELIKKPPHCLEYVVVHELVHLLERGHGDRFKAYMTQFMPNWRAYKAELNGYPI